LSRQFNGSALRFRTKTLLQSGSAWASRLAPALEHVRQMLPDAALSLEPYTDPESGETLLVVYARFPE
jgi:hypothetical protein